MKRAATLFHGLAVSLIVAVAATFLAEHYHASVMLFALLLGMAVNFLSQEGRCVPGIEFTSRTVLRLGVALLGMRITLHQVSDLGAGPVLMVLACVALTICCGMIAARLLGFPWAFGMLTGGAVGICGASAALAIAAAVPHPYPQRERALIFTVIGVSALSTLAMVAYPMLATALHLNAHDAGIFLGASIHDVAQVVGAGYGMSNETGDVATVVKLLRVATLLPVIFLLSLVVRMRSSDEGQRPPILPWFAVGFGVLVAINSSGVVPDIVGAAATGLSKWCLVAAISAIGMKTQLKELATVGWKPILLMVGETVFLALLAAGFLYCRN
ncbi:MAG: putative sulfate exporter family transporter [Pseudomonadota bacterium]